jgi:hypothetical protein
VFEGVVGLEKGGKGSKNGGQKGSFIRLSILLLTPIVSDTIVAFVYVGKSKEKIFASTPIFEISIIF